MENVEKDRCVDALEMAGKLFDLAQTQLHRARTQCDGELYERIDVIAKRAFELKVKADWLRYDVEGRIPPGLANARIASDRRVGVDRRIVGMQKVLLSAA